MNKVIEKLRQEWERAILMVVALLVLVVLLVSAYRLLNDDGGSTGQSSSLPALPNYFDTTSFVYVKAVKDLPPGMNPMVFRKQLVIPKAPPAPSKGGGAAPPKTGGAAAAPPKAGVKPPAPGKTEPPWVITVKYRGLYKGITGKEMAFVDAKNSKGNNQARSVGRKFYLPENGRVFNAMTVRSFDAQRIVLSYGKGKEVALELGKEKKVTIDE